MRHVSEVEMAFPLRCATGVVPSESESGESGLAVDDVLGADQDGLSLSRARAREVPCDRSVCDPSLDWQ